MSASADENTRSDLLDDFTTDTGETSSYVLWPAGPEGDTDGRVEIDLDDGQAWPGSSVTVEARVTTPARAEVQAVFRVQGLEPEWCPAPQVASIAPGAQTRLYLKLTPPPGTPPGRYLWSLTAEVPDRQMLAVTAALQVDRPQRAPPPADRSHRRLFTLLLVAAIVLVAALAGAVALLLSSRMPWAHDTSPAPRPTPTAAGPRAVLPTARPSGTPAGSAVATELVQIQGTVLADDDPGAIRISVTRLTVDDLNGTRPSIGSTELPGTTVATNGPTGTAGTDKKSQGKDWSLTLPPGLYGLTFTKPGYTPESIVVTTADVSTMPPPQVRLVRIASTATTAPD